MVGQFGEGVTNSNARPPTEIQSPLIGFSVSVQLLFIRVEGVACFRIITGHDYLQAHMFKIGLAWLIQRSALSVNLGQ
ncbi:hypothetical protein TNCV_1728661 [Trichonephila clavipes]|nr:hypothetical protein TNCV_1728661 [Trichonephila clavipes]